MRIGIPQCDPWRSRPRVRLARSRSKGLSTWRRARLLVTGKPTDNAFVESFSGKFRAECLNAHWFMSIDDALRKCEAWRGDCNEEPPHSAIRKSHRCDERSAPHGPAPDRAGWESTSRVIQRGGRSNRVHPPFKLWQIKEATKSSGCYKTKCDT